MNKKFIFILTAFCFSSFFSQKYFETTGVDMRDAGKFFEKVAEALELGKKELKVDDKIGWKMNINQKKASVLAEIIYPQDVGNTNLLKLLEKISNDEPVDYVEFYENSRILAMISVKNGQIRNEEPVRIVFMPINFHYKIDDIGQLREKHLKSLANTFADFVKKYDIQEPEFECNFGIGSEKYVHWTLKSKIKNKKIEELKEKLKRRELLRKVPISDSFKNMIKNNLQGVNNPEKIEDNNQRKENKSEKKVQFAVEVEEKGGLAAEDTEKGKNSLQKSIMKPISKVESPQNARELIVEDGREDKKKKVGNGKPDPTKNAIKDYTNITENQKEENALDALKSQKFRTFLQKQIFSEKADIFKKIFCACLLPIAFLNDIQPKRFVNLSTIVLFTFNFDYFLDDLSKRNGLQIILIHLPISILMIPFRLLTMLLRIVINIAIIIGQNK